MGFKLHSHTAARKTRGVRGALMTLVTSNSPLRLPSYIGVLFLTQSLQVVTARCVLWSREIGHTMRVLLFTLDCRVAIAGICDGYGQHQQRQ